MKRLSIAVLIFLLSISTAMAKQFTLEFTWDPNTEASMAGYGLFERVNNGTYDYNAPLDPTCTIIDGKCWTDVTDPANPANHYSKTVEVDIPAVSALTAVFNKQASTIDFAWEYTLTPPVTYSYVARARDIDNAWSEDSNEVSQTFDLGVTIWKLYQSTTSGGPYTEILSIPWDGSSNTISTTLDAENLAPGNTYYFTVVGFTADGVFSPNSNEVQIDRRPPTKVINLKITLLP